MVGRLPVVFADYDIPNPGIPGISTEDHEAMEMPTERLANKAPYRPSDLRRSSICQSN
ncbi:hypothetical protein ThrDRAFT_00601 [Frankia casuarinae]|nr:hypothetical protein CcI6DRAFT_00635 [Frankia sp. CcI6]EYT93849.1 hypothetical protein ThrDRAFT_00601 [Frankia casuarinae]KDA44493.1 hypothetical protein BMG523Draft_00669 [Frankia sp. BMG5.23]KEZ37138.1 hypothetical protein CEDDRAFT_01390 [Frankia sp. CeD]KFB04378.1 hypothetical protein ALLO2DRAFT_02829 [Frankia sp. Allo2]